MRSSQLQLRIAKATVVFLIGSIFLTSSNNHSDDRNSMAMMTMMITPVSAFSSNYLNNLSKPPPDDEDDDDENAKKIAAAPLEQTPPRNPTPDKSFAQPPQGEKGSTSSTTTPPPPLLRREPTSENVTLDTGDVVYRTKKEVRVDTGDVVIESRTGTPSTDFSDYLELKPDRLDRKLAKRDEGMFDDDPSKKKKKNFMDGFFGNSNKGGTATLEKKGTEMAVDEKASEKKWRVSNTVQVDSSGKSRTQRIMEKTSTSGQTGGAGGSSTWDSFQRAERNWSELRRSEPFVYDSKLLRRVQDGIPPPTQFVTMDGGAGDPESWDKLRNQNVVAVQEGDDDLMLLDYDVVVCGGTLGIFVAMALQLKGHSVCVIEGGPLKGREQEWNLSMNELMELVELGVLLIDDVEASVTTEFPGCRSGFKNEEAPTYGMSYKQNGIGYECFTEDVLNLGVTPSILLERVKNRFEEAGGVVKEYRRIEGIVVSELLGAAVNIGAEEEPVTARLVLDCMGNASPISRQQRYGMKPDGVCCVVGTCAGGYDSSTNLDGDIIYTNSEIQDKGENGKLQYFWEAFPVGIGKNGKHASDVKTTYMFTYLDADEKRPDLMALMEDYWDMLPTYQPSIKNPERDLKVKRVLSAYFPTFKDSPLQPEWSRILAVGDASGIQSPLSFGGFGALTRHLDRISGAISDALEKNCLHKDDLSLINAYTPNLSAAWMFQKAMSVRMGQKVDPKFINRLLATNFMVMEDMGIDTMKPFLQDVVRLDGLAGSLSRSFIEDPAFMPEIVKHVGVPTLVEWLGHVTNIGLYTAAHNIVSPVLGPVTSTMKNDPRKQFKLRRQMEAWKYGSGSDYTLPRNEKSTPIE